MKHYSSLLLLTITAAFSQEKIKHHVAAGETIFSIAKKYEVKESEIFQLNPKAKSKALQLNSVLWIPNKKQKGETNMTSTGKKPIEPSSLTLIHEVLAKETLYGISKRYQTTVDKIKEANPILNTKGLKLGSKITIPVSKEVFEAEQKTLPVSTTILTPTSKPEIAIPTTDNDEQIVHEVLPKETKYGISKKYNITIAELERLNPKTVKGLAKGEKLIIREGKVKQPTVVAQNPKEEIKPVITEQDKPEATKPAPAETGSKADIIIAKASENIGVPYRYGGIDKDGFDCSGLTVYAFKSIELELPRTSSDMAANAGVKIEKTAAKKGDLIFFDTMNRGDVSHVGIVTEATEDEIKFIHASSSMGVMISSTKEDYYSQRFIQVNRVL